MDINQRSSTPKDHYNWRIEHNSFSDIREFFPSWKLKGSNTFTTQSTTVEGNKAEEDSCAKAEEEEEAESSPGEDAETLSGAGRANQSVVYIVHFANTVKLYQRKIKIALGVVVLIISWKIVQRILARPPKKLV